jgi:hypothetical protein
VSQESFRPAFILKKGVFARMANKSWRPFFINLPAFFVLCFLITIPIFAQEENETSQLWERYKAARKLPCGERDTAIQTGKLILKLYRDERVNQDVIKYIEKDIASLIEKERTCARDNLYNTLYLHKYWQPFFEVSKNIIAEEGDTPLSLDVILTFVSVSFNRASVAKDDTYDSDILYYANLAIQRIEAGQESKNKNWGVFERFSTKVNAHGWMNFVIGWLYYYKLNRKNESRAYFDKAMQYAYTPTKYPDNSGTYLSAYELIGELYFDQLYKSAGELIKRNEKPRSLSAREKGYADRALIAYAKAFQMEMYVPRKDLIYNKLEKVYKFRFNLPVNEKPAGLNKFLSPLTKQPLPEPTEPVEPIFEVAVEVKSTRLRHSKFLYEIQKQPRQAHGMGNRLASRISTEETADTDNISSSTKLILTFAADKRGPARIKTKDF